MLGDGVLFGNPSGLSSYQACCGAAAQANGGNVFTDQTRVWVVAVVALTLSTNLISSGLLAYRIWMMERKVSTVHATSDTLMPIVRVLVDATIIYSGMLLVMLICFVSDNNAQFIIQDMIMPIIPIAFYMCREQREGERLAATSYAASAIHTPMDAYGLYLERSRESGPNVDMQGGV
ncbi:hypothetical protein DFJ58DRAFT_887002 [Suillus subalutaceus]|uniref:uncharacterized protein n=1 Tax=Suillus subalutaceus TaxID=48586 RepID=UPI001B87528A|nr:uncharacterized protein DFJ58DRAFT_887002 [Suillus subalutaceus]KAG1850811.1 hypothetical protein DFJ58DRAFT_887002 [Suillus subalutaceus]